MEELHVTFELGGAPENLEVDERLFDPLIPFLQETTTLEELTLENLVSGFNVQYFSEGLADNKSLEEVAIDFSCFTNIGDE